MLYHIMRYLPVPDTLMYKYLASLLGFNGSGGYLGVVFFFILSGFLISYLLFQERETKGRISLSSFYVRRILRIWPLYYLTVLVGFYFYPLLATAHIETANLLYYIFFAANFDHIWNETTSLGILGVQWSVAVEEQFYLLWPLLFLIRKSTLQCYLFILTVVLSELFYLSQSDWKSAYFHFFSSIRFLGIGAILAYIAFYKRNWINWLFDSLSKSVTIVIYAVSISLLFMRETWISFDSRSLFAFDLLSFLFFSFVILEQCYSKNSFFKMCNSKILGWIGKRSYGIYLMHMMSLYFVLRGLEWLGYYQFALAATAIILLTLIGSHLSFTYFESFFLRLKAKFKP